MAETSNRTDEPVLGRPRSESARRAVLNAVDDMLVEHGYAALTLKGIAEQAGVGRQTIYRWWSTKAEILHEAGVPVAALAPAPTPRTMTAAAVNSLACRIEIFFMMPSFGGRPRPRPASLSAGPSSASPGACAIGRPQKKTGLNATGAAIPQERQARC